MHIPVFHRSKKKFIGKLTLLGIGIICWMIAIMNQIFIDDYHGAVSIRYKEPQITARSIENIIDDMISREEHTIPEVTLWQRDEDILITNEDKKASIGIGLVTVVGDMSKVYPNAILYGGYLTRGDYEGCVIDKDTAYQLFGSENVVGLTIGLNQKEYTIAGVLQGLSSNTMIIQEEIQAASKVEGKKYSCMELAYSDTWEARRLAESFVNTYGLGTPVAYIDGYSYGKLSYFLIHLPLWFGALMLIVYFIRGVNTLEASRILYFSGWLGIILLGVLLFKITNVHIYFSGTMLPTRWSDFDFWGKQWKLLKASFGGREGSIILYKDMILTRRMTLVLTGALLAMLSLGGSMKTSGADGEDPDKPELP